MCRCLTRSLHSVKDLSWLNFFLFDYFEGRRGMGGALWWLAHWKGYNRREIPPPRGAWSTFSSQFIQRRLFKWLFQFAPASEIDVNLVSRLNWLNRWPKHRFRPSAIFWIGTERNRLSQVFFRQIKSKISSIFFFLFPIIYIYIYIYIVLAGPFHIKSVKIVWVNVGFQHAWFLWFSLFYSKVSFISLSLFLSLSLVFSLWIDWMKEGKFEIFRFCVPPSAIGWNVNTPALARVRHEVNELPATDNLETPRRTIHWIQLRIDSVK